MLRQLLQAVLQDAEHALRAAASLRRVGGDMLDAQPPERPADLRQPAAIDCLAGPQRHEVMAAAIGLEAERQALGVERPMR
jgi:hypothetical protein